MTADYVMVPCIVCGRERPILTTTNVWRAWKQRCKACTSEAIRTYGISTQAEVDEVAVQRLLAGQPPARTTRAERQQAVAYLLGKHMTNEAIARRLHLARRTVERLHARTAS